MYEVLRAHGAETGRHLPHEVPRHVLAHPPVFLDELGHVPPRAVLEDEEDPLLLLDDVVESDDVPVPAALQDLDLGLQGLAQLAVELVQADLLDRDALASLGVPRAPHDREGPAADLLVHLPVPDPARGDGRGGDGRRRTRLGGSERGGRRVDLH